MLYNLSRSGFFSRVWESKRKSWESIALLLSRHLASNYLIRPLQIAHINRIPHLRHCIDIIFSENIKKPIVWIWTATTFYISAPELFNCRYQFRLKIWLSSYPHLFCFHASADMLTFFQREASALSTQKIAKLIICRPSRLYIITHLYNPKN